MSFDKQVEELARALTEAQREYLEAVRLSAEPYEARHGRIANTCLRHGYVETVVRMPDGREGAWDDFSLEERIDPGIERILGQRLTARGALILEQANVR